jgi:hypothetical protein
MAKGGKRAGAGRKKGTQNKINAEIKDMLRQALDESGGVEYFKKQAKDNPVSFNTLIAKIIPADVNAKLAGNITIKVVQFSE